MGGSVGWTATVAAFMATKPTGGTALHLERERRVEAERRMAKAGYFASRWKGAAPGSPRGLPRGVDMRRRKIVGRRHCRAGPTVGRSPSRRPRCGSQTLWHPDGNGGTAATFLLAGSAANAIKRERLRPHGDQSYNEACDKTGPILAHGECELRALSFGCRLCDRQP